MIYELQNYYQSELQFKYQRDRYFMACNREHFFCFKTKTKKFAADGRFLLTGSVVKYFKMFLTSYK